MESQHRALRYFGQKVRALRKQRGWKLDDLGRRIGKGKASMSRIEHGNQNLTMMDVIRISEVLEVDIADLFDGGKVPPMDTSASCLVFVAELRHDLQVLRDGHDLQVQKAKEIQERLSHAEYSFLNSDDAIFLGGLCGALPPLAVASPLC